MRIDEAVINGGAGAAVGAPYAAPTVDGFVDSLARFDNRTAIVTATGTVNYRDLAARVAAAAEQLGSARRLVMLPAENTIDSLVWYLAALTSGNPLLVVPADSPEAVGRIAAQYQADVALGSDGSMVEYRSASAHELHPELALLMSTSGSTGSPKLVRLSMANLTSNAAAIADYLQLRSTDRAITTLPMAYCYGLSVINSHLHVGASIVLTQLSVVDTCFWTLAQRAGVTNLAGVPYTFDLIDKVGRENLALPSLRFVTQAGGRLGPDRVRSLAEYGQRNGWDFVVMYGQTEATARMAYLPADRAFDAPEAIGVPIPGGDFTLVEGEIVYRGPNVMLGYAHEPKDLAFGRTITELPTGDLARRRPDGLYEITGRKGRFLKAFGKRIDFAEVESRLASAGIDALCVLRDGDGGTDGRLNVAVAGSASAQTAGSIARAAGIPIVAVDVLYFDELPRTASGKPDARAIRRCFDGRDASAASAGSVAADKSVDSTGQVAGPLRDRDAVVTGDAVVTRDAVDNRDAVVTDRDAVIAEIVGLYERILNWSGVKASDSFVSLGGDSMSYVEMSARLALILPDLPVDWHVRPIAELLASRSAGGSARRSDRISTSQSASKSTHHPAGLSRIRSRHRARYSGPSRALDQLTTQQETNVLLRALAVLIIVGSHVTVFDIRGGAHLLIAIAGYNFARFQLIDERRRERLVRIGRSIARIAIPSAVWMLGIALLDSQYSLANVFFLHNVVAPAAEDPAWRYWFVEALLYVLLAAAALVAVPRLYRWQVREPFYFAVALVGVGLVFRFGVFGDPNAEKAIFTPWMVFFLFAIGWAIARAVTWPQRLVVVGLVVLTVPGYSATTSRVVVIVAGLLLLLLLPMVRIPRFLAPVTAGIAGASLFIYLSHWQVYPVFGDANWLAVVAAVAVGVVLSAGYQQIVRLASASARSISVSQLPRIWRRPHQLA